MTERLGAISSPRPSEDVLMGAFGTPDSANTKTITTSSSAAAATGLMIDKWYRVVATQDAYIHFHATENATSSHMFIKGGIPEVFYTGTVTRVSALQVSSAGTVFLTPLITNSRVV